MFIKKKIMLSYEITSPTEARNSLFQLLDKVTQDHQVFIINRRNQENVALIAESDLRSLLETVYLLRSSANSRHLFDALEESTTGKIKPQSLEELKEELEFE